MSWLALATRSLLVGSLGVFGNCTFSDNRPHCSTGRDCAPNQECFKGFCVQAAADGGSPDRSAGRGGNTRPNAGRTGSTSNPSEAAGRGGAGEGGRMETAGRGGDANPAGTGGAMPAAGSGGGPDITCQDGDQRPCTLEGPSSGGMSEQCNRGLQLCSNGRFGDCTAQEQPTNIREICNGLDDNCNGEVDEDIHVACYPEGSSGCSKVGDSYSCAGVCRAGTQTCTNGELGPCTGFTAPSAESCANTADENCDGSSDENCACTGSAPRACYTGAANTQNVGECKGGTQTCTNGTLGPCTGQTTNAPETCANEGKDNDCDGVVDNIPDRGSPCLDSTKKGPCMLGTLQCQAGKDTLVCVTPAGTTEICNGIVDDDCDGKVDEGFDLMTDEMHCGSCTRSCTSGQTCCGGSCKDTKTDADFCGGCEATNKCATGETCCNSLCKDTKTDANFCGGCAAANKCATGNSCCDGRCFDLQTEEMHCGTCATACVASTQQCCAGSCIGIDDPKNCGSCNKVCEGMVGVDGGMEACMCTASGTTATCSAGMTMCP